MIRPLGIPEIPDVLPLLYELWQEQQATRQEFNPDYLVNALSYALSTEDFTVLTTDAYDCILIGHCSPSICFPDKEGVEDLLFIQQDKRGSTRFVRLIEQFEKFCKQRGAILVRVGVGTGIMDAKVAALYTRLGYLPAYQGFKKEI